MTVSRKLGTYHFADGILLYSQILDPFSLLEHPGTDDAFYKIGTLTDGKQGNDGHIREPAETESQGDTDNPDKAAVKEEGDEGLTAGTEGEVGGVGVGVKGHHGGVDADEPHGQGLNLFGGVVDPGEQTGYSGHEAAEDNAGHDGQGQQLPTAVPDFCFLGAAAQHLAHDNTHRIAQGQEYHAGQLEQGAGNVLGWNHSQAAGGIALIHNGHAAGPERFIHQKGHTLDDDGFQQPAGQIDGAVSPHDEGVLFGVQMCPAGHNGQLHKAGGDSCQCGTLNTHLGSTEVTENQNVVAYQVYNGGGNAGHHGYKGVAGFFQRAGISIGQCEGQEAPDHDVQILQTVTKNFRSLSRIAFTGQIQTDEKAVTQQEQGNANGRDGGTDQNFKTEGIADTFFIAGTVELCSEDTRAGAGTEDAKVKYENQTVDNGNAAHRHRTDLTHHNIVQHGNEVGNTRLNNNGNRYGKDPAVEGLVADITLEHEEPLKKKCRGGALPLPSVCVR